MLKTKRKSKYNKFYNDIIKKRLEKYIQVNKKITTTLVIGATVIGGAVFAQDAHAADKPTPEQDTTSNLVTKTKEGKTKKEDVTKAKSELDQANKKVEEKNKEVADKTNSVNKAAGEVEKAKEDVDKVKKVTPDTIKDTKGKLDAIKDDKARIETKKQEAEVSKEEIDKDIAKKTQEAKDGSKAADEKKALIKDIEKRLSELKDSAKLLADKKREKEQVAKDLEKAKKDLEQRKKELEEATKNDAEQNEDIEKLAKNIDEQIKKVKEIQERLNLAKKQEIEAKEKLDSAVNPFGTAKTTLKVSENFVRALKEYQKNPSEETLKRVIEAEKADKENAVKPPRGAQYKDDTDLVDLKNMSKADKELFSQYFTYLLNQVRAQFGLPPRKYNLNTQKLADDIARIAMRDKFDEEKSYTQGIKEAAKENGLNDAENYYENQAYGYAPIKDGSKVSRRYLFDLLHSSAQWFFYEGASNNHYNHALNLLKDHENIALSFIPTAKTSQDNTLVKLSIISVPKASVNDESKYEEKYGKNSTSNVDNVKLPNTKALEDEYNEAKTNADTIKSELDEANKVLEKLKTEHKNKVDSVEGKVESAQKAKDAAEKIVKDLEKKEAEVEADIVRLQGYIGNEADETTRLNTELDKLKNELVTIKADITAKEQEVDKLKRLSEEKAKEIDTRQGQIDAFDKLIAKVQADLDEQQRLYANRGAVEKALTKANEELARVKKELDLAKDELESLKGDAQTKQKKYNDIQKQYELEKLTYATTKDAPTVEKPEFKFEVPKDAPTVEKPEFDISKLAKPTDPSKPTSPVNPTKPTNPTLRAGNKEMEHNQKQRAILPKTGENTKSSVFAGLIMLVTSIILKRRKVK